VNPRSTQYIDQIVREILPPSEEWRHRALAHLDQLTKPLGSLGRLEELAAQIVAIRRERFAETIHKGVYIFAADHGITAEGVSAYPREVTRQMVLNFLAEGAAVNVLSRLHDLPGLIHRKIARGTRNMLHESAMTDDELTQAFIVGAEMAAYAVSSGQSMVAIGEMGIGNTTAASAITCALTGASGQEATGRGTGLTGDAHSRKVAIVQEVGRRHFGALAVGTSAVDVLRCVGGLEIAAMTGMILAAASHKLVVVIDGFISTAAAALAVAISPATQGYLVAGHQSEEPGHKLLLNHLRLTPVLSLNMRLGEGTGAVLALPMLESAIALYTKMATFDSAGVSGASS
jgi:nicotinate-nucleotide--dimethylbenzimidazole phosphoribosyltransferase